MTEATSEFSDAIREAGLEPPDVIEPGRLHRFPGRGKRSSNRAGWCRLFEDGRGGAFGDWSSGLSANWQAGLNRPRSTAEQEAYYRETSAACAAAANKRRAIREKAAIRALSIWETAKPAPAGHPYLRRKCIRPHDARLHLGALVLPIINFDDQLSSLQFIGLDGDKRLLAGGRKRGCCITVAGDRTAPTRVIICEGWATGCTLAEAEPHAVVLAAIDAGNLEPVAAAARRRWPTAELVIAGDDDRLTAGNPGASKARAAAIASTALLALPQWPADAPEHLTDFNDLAVWLAGGAR